MRPSGDRINGNRLRSGRASAIPEQKFANLLLSSLDEAGRARISSMARRVTLHVKQVLYRPEEKITEIYFPEDCVLAMLTVMKNGATIESATVGREGASWISASFKSPTMPCQTMVAIAGDAYKLPTSAVEDEIKRNGKFHDTLSHYAHTLLIQVLRSAACNGLHNMQQRCTRWMLMTLDRTDAQQFSITHEFLASLLGVQRTGLSQLVERLAALNVLDVRRGKIHIANREKLEQLTCECYSIVREQFAAFTGT